MTRVMSGCIGWLAALGAAVAAAQTRPDLIVARVGSTTITAADLRDVLADQRRTGEMTTILEALTPAGQRRTLQQLADARLMALGARQNGLADDPVVKRAIDRAVEQALAQQVVRVEMDKLDLSDDALRKYFEGHADRFRTGQRAHVRHIVVATEAEAAATLEELKRGVEFASIAGARNIDASKARAGDLGWIQRGLMVKAFDDAAFALKSGDTSGVVKTGFGYHVIRAEQTDPGRLPAFETAREQVRQRVVAERVDAVRQSFSAKFPVSIDDAALREAVR